MAHCRSLGYPKTENLSRWERDYGGILGNRYHGHRCILIVQVKAKMSFNNAPSRADLELSHGPIDPPTAQVFLAYADEDRDLSLAAGNLSAVEAIRQLLVEAGLSLWDRDSNLGPQEDPEMAISRATEASDNYVILLSSHTLQNALCLQGLLFALSMNKRILPVLLDTVEVDHLPDPLRTITWQIGRAHV